jgi:hypothetical protein
VIDEGARPKNYFLNMTLDKHSFSNESEQLKRMKFRSSLFFNYFRPLDEDFADQKVSGEAERVEAA